MIHGSEVKIICLNLLGLHKKLFISEGYTELPHRWAPMPTDKTYLTVQINSTDEEYKKVIANLAQPTLAVQKVD